MKFILKIWNWLNLKIIGGPWWAFGASRYFQDVVSSNSRILEFGSGNSTLWLAKRYTDIYSIEHSDDYFRKVSEKLRNYGNVAYFLRQGESYYNLDDLILNEPIDVVIIDGKYRCKCLINSLRLCNSNGFWVVIDNIESIFEREGEEFNLIFFDHVNNEELTLFSQILRDKFVKNFYNGTTNTTFFKL